MSLASNYASGILAAAGERNLGAKDLDRVQAELSLIAQAVEESRELKITFAGPMSTTAEKLKIAAALSQKVGAHELTANVLKLLARKGRLGNLTEIAEGLGAARLAAEGGLTGRIESAEELTAADVAELSESFGKKLGRKVAFKVAVNPSLLAGLKVTLGGVTYDGTVRSQLRRLRDRLLEKTETVH